AGVYADDVTVGGREDGERQRVKLAEPGRRLPAFGLPDQDRVIEVHGGRELDDRLRPIDGDADDGEPLVLFLDGLQQRDFAQARCAPRRPEVDQERLAGPAVDGALL